MIELAENVNRSDESNTDDDKDMRDCIDNQTIVCTNVCDGKHGRRDQSRKGAVSFGM